MKYKTNTALPAHATEVAREFISSNILTDFQRQACSLDQIWTFAGIYLYARQLDGRGYTRLSLK